MRGMGELRVRGYGVCGVVMGKGLFEDDEILDRDFQSN